jgi:hypothetical protein
MGRGFTAPKHGRQFGNVSLNSQASGFFNAYSVTAFPPVKYLSAEKEPQACPPALTA